MRADYLACARSCDWWCALMTPKGHVISVYAAEDLALMYFTVFGAAVATFALSVLLYRAVGLVRNR